MAKQFYNYDGWFRVIYNDINPSDVLKYDVISAEHFNLLGKLYVNRPIPDAANPPKIVSFTSSAKYSHLVYDDGYVCDVWHDIANIPPLMKGVFIESDSSREYELMSFYQNTELIVEYEATNKIKLIEVPIEYSEEEVGTCGTCTQMSIGDALMFTLFDKSAKNLLLNGVFTEALWSAMLLPQPPTHRAIKTKTDYLYIAEYLVIADGAQPPYSPHESIYVARPLNDINTTPKVTSLKSCHDYTQMTYDDGYVCNVWHGHKVPSLMNGMVLDAHNRDKVLERKIEHRPDNILVVKETIEHGLDIAKFDDHVEKPLYNW